MTETRPAEAWNNVNSDVVRQFRSDNGKISSGMFKGARLLLLTTTGAKSGKERINPLAFTRDGDNYVIIASKGGSPTHPDWYHNILANPEVGVEVATQSGVDQFRAYARIAAGEERRRLYAAQAAVMPNFAEYQKKTERKIPVVVLEPRRQT
ncbi:MAG: nitroreductase family deazaflavin-dependent oxidoreductase [Chloroflexi bacterium]|nr:nitroreductase family deazaflavin-dependent oxidoreductase [Chloroflexota bacterium]MBV9895763.1 nitroreductase family deazaflavin-dependent oxidoreductase [Chloroflexota bacterium]